MAGPHNNDNSYIFYQGNLAGGFGRRTTYDEGGKLSYESGHASNWYGHIKNQGSDNPLMALFKKKKEWKILASNNNFYPRNEPL